jgi:hypothetical protein
VITGQDPREFVTYKKTRDQIGEEAELQALAMLRNANPDALVWRPKDHPKTGYCLSGYVYVPVIGGSGGARPICNDLIQTGGRSIGSFYEIRTSTGGRRPDIVRAQYGVITLYEIKENNSPIEEEQELKDHWIALH